MSNLCFLWPEQIDIKQTNFTGNADVQQTLDQKLIHVSRLIRLRSFHEAELILLSIYNDSHQDKVSVLSCWLALEQRQFRKVQKFLELWANSKSSDCSDKQYLFWCFHSRCDYRHISPDHQLQPIVPSRLTSQSWYTKVALAEYLLKLGRTQDAKSLYDELSSIEKNLLESLLLCARLHCANGMYQEALAVLEGLIEKFPTHQEVQEFACGMALASRSNTRTIPIIRNALTSIYQSAELLCCAAQLQMLQKKQADARRTSLLERVQTSLAINDEHSQKSNLLNLYMELGNVDWLDYSISGKTYSWIDLSYFLRINLCMQYASFHSSNVQPCIQSVIKDMKNEALNVGLDSDCSVLNSGTRDYENDKSKQLTIAWCSSDITYHPVSRFIYSFFANSLNCLKYKHLIVDTFNHQSESNNQMFQDLPNLEYVDLGRENVKNKISVLRERKIDLALDLSGWTGGNFQDGFLSRFANTQINYLGYFASTGNPSIDYWLGDHNLFPTPMEEWHSEELIRLNRCFIAWQPANPLPEASVECVSSSQTTFGIHFGSFNHNRKLSDNTLRLWGRILESNKESRLVLKASNQDDVNTMELLKRRMIRNGLDYSKVVWLARTKTPQDHLLQYAHIDVALDTFPNGGCTTTCEALWMGVPVITLTGNSYVSRMSTAVLCGAGMSEWCASSEDEYLELSIKCADNLISLRSNREKWRNKLINSPLGNASNLMVELESSFSRYCS